MALRHLLASSATAGLLATAALVSAPAASAAPAPAKADIIVCTYKVVVDGARIRTRPGGGVIVGHARLGSYGISAPNTVKNGFVKASWTDKRGVRHPGTWVAYSNLKNMGCHREP